MHEKLLDGIVNGDESAYKSLFDEYYKRMANFAFRYLRDREIAKDVVQSVFVKIYQNRKQLLSVKEIKHYLFKSVQHECLNEIKRIRTRDHYQEEYASRQDVIFFEQSLEQSEKEYKLFQAIETLSPKCKEIFLKSRIKGKKNQEIADELNISIRTVETQISVALKNLRNTLGLLIASIPFLKNL